jgi:acetyl-CoA carboxylase biotin carboxyl carrier protein
MDDHEIKTLIEAMASSDLTEMEVCRNGWTLRLVRRAGTGARREPPPRRPPLEPELPAPEFPAPEFPVGDPAMDRDASLVRAPVSGLVYLAPSPEDPPFAPLGGAVQAGATVCVIEAMKVFIEVRAERGGPIEAVLVASGDEVQADQPLLRIG